MIWVGMIGADGLVANVLTKLIASHPRAQISTFLSGQQFKGCESKKYTEWSIFDVIEKSDVIFNALPHKNSSSIFNEAVKQGKKVIDLSSDVHNSVNVIETQAKPVYGIPELNKEKIMEAFVVSNPSCYCTGAMLGLAPLVEGKLIDVKSVIIDSKSGVTSLSKSDTLVESFVDNNENVKAYKLGSNCYSAEIEQQVQKLFGEKLNILYAPYIVPMSKGILTTIYATPSTEVDTESLIGKYKEFYQDNPFIRVYEEGEMPETKRVSYSNYCDIGIHFDKAADKIVAVTAIDNLMKGACGQAVQNMNLMCGMDEKTGLPCGSIAV